MESGSASSATAWTDAVDFCFCGFSEMEALKLKVNKEFCLCALVLVLACILGTSGSAAAFDEKDDPVSAMVV